MWKAEATFLHSTLDALAFEYIEKGTATINAER
jgi:hypothetical protein